MKRSLGIKSSFHPYYCLGDYLSFYIYIYCTLRYEFFNWPSGKDITKLSTYCK